MCRLVLAVATSLSFSLGTLPVAAWDGYDYDAGNYVEIGRGELVRSGEEIEFFDYGAGEYRYGTVEDINRSGSSVEVEVYDHESGEYRTFEMEGD
jgi:hypothetical protein